MIQKMSHTTIYVLDQDQAKDFYVGKLGFEVKVDQSLPTGFRWLTVAPKGQSELEIILMKLGSGGDFDKMKGGSGEENTRKDVETVAALLKKGMFGPGAFQTSDCRKTFEELKARVQKALDYVKTFSEADLAGGDDREVTVRIRGEERKLTGETYFLTRALPNFYFHVTTAYAILRKNGAPIGKNDYLG